MTKKKKMKSGLIFLSIILICLIGSIVTADPHKEHESIQNVMKDAVLHESGKVQIIGDYAVNPGLISAFCVTGIMLIICLIIRIFFIPKFKIVPGRVQLIIEQAVGIFDGMVKGNSPHRNNFLGAYVFTAGAYIFVSTLFELAGVQMKTVSGGVVALPAPLSDINGAICLGCLSYLVIMSGGIAANGAKGIGKTLKDFSLPISMSFRLFGALLSGALVTELVYHYTQLSYVLPVIVAVLFTLLHALIQAYVLTMLTSLFYGEVSEPVHH